MIIFYFTTHNGENHYTLVSMREKPKNSTSVFLGMCYNAEEAAEGGKIYAMFGLRKRAYSFRKM